MPKRPAKNPTPQPQRHPDRIKIQLLDETSLANVVSIQPIFHDNGVINESHIFFIYRKIKGNKIKYFCESRLRKGEENKIIHENMIPHADLNKIIYKMMHKDARHFFLLGAIDRWLKAAYRIDREINNVSHMMKCNNFSFLGSTILVSNKRVIEQKSCENQYYMNLKFIYTDETIPENMIIQVATGDSNFDRPIVACPIINRKHFQEFCARKNIHPEDIPIEPKKSVFPVIQKFHYVYKLYEEFINENPPQWWYVENLGGDMTEHYYTTIRFLLPKKEKSKERERMRARRRLAERIVYRRRLEREAKNSEKA